LHTVHILREKSLKYKAKQILQVFYEIYPIELNLEQMPKSLKLIKLEKFIPYF